MGKHTNAKQCTDERKAPMVKLPSRTPTWSIEEVQQKAGKVHTSIAQKEKHSDSGRNQI
jgi:hypothetical protein